MQQVVAVVHAPPPSLLLLYVPPEGDSRILDYSAIHPLCRNVLLPFWLQVVRAVGSYSIAQKPGEFPKSSFQNLATERMNSPV